jgi:hypothetical protein
VADFGAVELPSIGGSSRRNEFIRAQPTAAAQAPRQTMIAARRAGNVQAESVAQSIVCNSPSLG